MSGDAPCFENWWSRKGLGFDTARSLPICVMTFIAGDVENLWGAYRNYQRELRYHADTI